MDEAELARQMEKAELENAEIGGIAHTKCTIVGKVNAFCFAQAMMINLTWKRKELEATRLVVEKKGERKEKRKRRNENITLLFFNQSREILRFVATLLRLHNLKKLFVSYIWYIPELHDNFSDVISLGGVLACQLGLINVKDTLNNRLKVSFID